MSMIHASNTSPRINPYDPEVDGTQMDRVQEISGSITLNRAKIKEVGRDGIVDWKQQIPSLTMTMRQYEYGTVELYQKIINDDTLGNDSETAIALTDFKTPQFDISAYKEDDDDTFLGTAWYPKLRCSGFSINIGDPDAIIERNFNFVGEDEIFLTNDNKYVVYGTASIASGEAGNYDIVIGSGTYANYPAPVEDPDNSGQYILRVARKRSDTVSDLTYTTDYTYTSGTNTLTVLSCLAGDEIEFVYSATTYISGASLFTNNDVDTAAISADSAVIYLATDTRVYKLQSVGIDVTYDRTDYKEIGNDEVVQRGARDITVRITLGRLLDSYTIEEVLRGVADLSFGKINARKFSDDITLYVKLYSDSDQDTFLMGYKFTGLSPVDADLGIPVDEYLSRGVTLEGESGTITADETLL